MNRLPSNAIVERLRKQYPKGAVVELDYMDDIAPVPVGTKGTVICVDDIGSIHVKWDNGSRLAVAYGVDICHVIKE